MERFFITLMVVLVVLAGVGSALFFGLGFWLSPQDPLAKSDAIVAISGGETTSRAMEAVQLYKQGWAPTLIFSGAAADQSGPSNARAMQQLALAEGVPATAIQLDEDSATTTENATQVASIVRDHHYHQIILVTSPYHQRRASITFERALGSGVVILNHSTTDHRWRRSEWWANDYSRSITLAELQKTLFLLITRRASS